MSPSRTIAIKSFLITAVELNATAYGQTAEAIDVVKESWTKLGEIAKQDGELEDQPGDWAYKTQMVVNAPGLLDRAFPGVRETRRLLEGADSRLKSDARGSFRIEVRSHYDVHGLPHMQNFVVEPRVASKPGDEIYFTVSPLRSEEHRAWLQAVMGGGT
jgi:hypothetical protein